MENIEKVSKNIEIINVNQIFNAREKMKMCISFYNYIHGVNCDFIANMKTIQQFLKNKLFIDLHMEYLEKDIDDVDKYIKKNFRGNLGKAKKEEKEKYVNLLGESKKELEQTKRIYDIMFFEGAEQKYEIG